MASKALLAAVVIASFAATTTPAGAVPADHTPVPPTIQDLGPGILSAPITGAARDGQDVYLVSRGLVPPVVARFDLTTQKIVAHATLSSGIGGWAATMSGGKVYAGTYHPADIHRYDPATNTTTRIARLGAEDFVFDLTTGPDGTLYAGTNPSGKVYAVDPVTGASRDLGQASPGQQYVRSIAAAPDGTVYAGTGTAARLVAIDPATGQKTDITPPELRTESFVYDVAASADVVAIGTEPSGRLAIVNRHDPTQYKILDTGNATVDSIAINGNEVVASTRPSGTVFRYDLTTGAFGPVGAPTPQDETRGVFADSSNTIVGVAGTGQVWSMDKTTGAVRSADIVQAGMPTDTEPVQSVSVQDSRFAYVGGNFGLQVHDQRAQTSTHERTGGETKAAVPVGGQLYMAIYPGAFIDSYDPRTQTVTRRATIGGGQNRPRALTYLPSRGELGIGSRAEYGHTGGAFSLMNVRTSKITRYDDPLPDQGITAVAFAGSRTAYLGGEINADGVPPVAPAAQVATFDLRKGKVVQRWTPVPGAAVITDLVARGRLLYGVTDTGLVFVADPVRQRVLHTYQLTDKAGVKLVPVSRGRLLAVTFNSVFVLGETSAATLVTGLQGDWYNYPEPAYDAHTDQLYTIRGRNLVKLSLHG